jgi:23S rRNA pseudouridine2605 synthase
MTDEQRHEAGESELSDTPETKIEDPIGDETDGEAKTSITTEEEAEIEAAEDAAEGRIKAEIEDQEKADAVEHEEEPEFKPKPRPPAKLERLQKILAQAGVASRRKAEEMIEQGRVQVNGKVVTELGTKADAGRDHIRVDGKLLQGAERLRYFVLNKPRGFVTTVKDPEGRPTVMQFFDKMRERLYPVGRLDYMSEGLLLVTNDGELANRLTRAAAGVEKTYLVKVAGKPTEDELDLLRAGVAIEKGGPGSGKVRTSPARIRQVRQGDNPWYEVVLIEGRNRELRKMFEEVGHFVEKIRRVGYGPLILDQEPGNLRELDEKELELLRKAADGTLRTPKAKEIRRRNIVDSLPPEKPAFKTRGERPAAGPKDYRPKKSFGVDKPVRSGSGPARFGAGPAKFESGPAKFGPGRPVGGQTPRPAWKKDDRTGEEPRRPAARFGAGPTRPDRPTAGRSFGDGPGAGRAFGVKPAAGRTFGAKPGTGKPFGAKPATGRGFPAKPAWKKPESQEWPPYKRPPAPRPEMTRRRAPEPIDEPGPKRPSRLHIEPIRESERPERARTDRTGPGRTGPDRTGTDRPRSNRPGAAHAGSGRFGSGRSGPVRSGAVRSGAGHSSSTRPFRSEGGLARPFTTSSGKPRAGGARPSSKPGGRSYSSGGGAGGGTGRSGARTGADSRPSFGAKRPSFRNESAGRNESGGSPASRPSRPYPPRGEGAEGFRARGEESRPERRTGSGWKPKPSFGGKPKPGGSDRTKPKTGGFSKSGAKGSGAKGRPGDFGAKRSGPPPGKGRPGGKSPGGAGRKRP